MGRVLEAGFGLYMSGMPAFPAALWQKTVIFASLQFIGVCSVPGKPLGELCLVVVAVMQDQADS